MNDLEVEREEADECEINRTFKKEIIPNFHLEVITSSETSDFVIFDLEKKQSE